MSENNLKKKGRVPITPIVKKKGRFFEKCLEKRGSN